jgi:mediator of RNA polymerase II transcription subunit 13
MSTPVSTPVATPMGVSPDPHSLTPAATPSEMLATEAANDPDAHLVDTTDETYCLIMAHRINLIPAQDDFFQALASGLLVKIPPAVPTKDPFEPSDILGPTTTRFIALHLLSCRASAKQSDSLGASNLPHNPMFPKNTTDSILREYLGSFRGLGLLSRLRGIPGSMSGLIPWHILAAVKAVEGLDSMFGTEKM